MHRQHSQIRAWRVWLGMKLLHRVVLNREAISSLADLR